MIGKNTKLAPQGSAIDCVAVCKYFTIEACEQESTGKTRDYIIRGISGPVIGYINLYAPWRKYVFAPCAHTFWSHNCLCEVLGFLENMNALKHDAARTKQEGA